MFVKLVQSLKAPSPILVTLSGIVIFANLLQPEKAYLLIVVILLPITTLIKLL